MSESSKPSRFSAFSGIGFRIPRVSRRIALELSTLAVIVAITVIFRVIKVSAGPYMDAYDPSFQYRVTKYVLENGYSSYFSWYDNMTWWPWGRNIATSSYPGIPFSGAFVYQILAFLGFNFSVYEICLYFPVLMAVITVIAIYYLGNELGGSSVGLLSAFFMAINEAFIGRTSIGFYDTENIGIFGMVTVSLFFLRSIDRKKPIQEKIAYAVGAGLVLGYIFASWGAARYAVGLLTLYIVAALFLKQHSKENLISYTITMVVGFFIATFIPNLGYKYLTSMENVLAIFIILSLAAYEVLSQRYEPNKLLLIAAGLLVASLIGIFSLEYLGLIKPITGKFLRVLIPGAAPNALYETVAEHKRSVWASYFSSFGVPLIFGIFGTYVALKNPDNRSLFATIFFVTGIYFTGSMTRLGLILSIPASLMAAYGAKELLSPIVKIARTTEDRRGRRRRTTFGMSRELAIIFSLLIFAAILPTIWGTAEASVRPTSLASSGIPGTVRGSYPQDWIQTLAWMKDNLPDDAVVAAWWDYGYWITAMAEKITLADGNTSNSTQIRELAKIMLHNESYSLPVLEKFDATHIVVFQTFYNPDDPTQQWPFGENSKWSAMASIAGYNISDYISGSAYTDLFLDSLLSKLMSISPPSGCNLVYWSDNQFVLVYELDYEAAQT